MTVYPARFLFELPCQRGGPAVFHSVAPQQAHEDAAPCGGPRRERDRFYAGQGVLAPGGDLDAVSQEIAGHAELLKRFPKRPYPPVKVWPYSHFRC